MRSIRRVADLVELLAEALRGVDVHVDVWRELAGDAGDVLDRPGLVVDVHHRDEPGVGPD